MKPKCVQGRRRSHVALPPAVGRRRGLPWGQTDGGEMSGNRRRHDDRFAPQGGNRHPSPGDPADQHAQAARHQIHRARPAVAQPPAERAELAAVHEPAPLPQGSAPKKHAHQPNHQRPRGKRHPAGHHQGNRQRGQEPAGEQNRCQGAPAHPGGNRLRHIPGHIAAEEYPSHPRR